MNLNKRKCISCGKELSTSSSVSKCSDCARKSIQQTFRENPEKKDVIMNEQDKTSSKSLIMNEIINKYQESLDIVNRVNKSYSELYETYGVEPNAILMSTDLISALSNSPMLINTFNGEATIQEVMGLKVIPVIGTDFIRAIIM